MDLADPMKGFVGLGIGQPAPGAVFLSYKFLETRDAVCAIAQQQGKIAVDKRESKHSFLFDKAYIIISADVTATDPKSC